MEIIKKNKKKILKLKKIMNEKNAKVSIIDLMRLKKESVNSNTDHLKLHI